MEKENVNSILTSYVRENLSPTKEERLMVSRKYDEICRLLVGDQIFQSGSYARFTAITPVSDLDIIWVIPQSVLEKKIRIPQTTKAVNPHELKLSDILVDFAKKLEDEYIRIGQRVKVKSQTRSVGVYFGEEDEFSIDVVPAVISGEKNEYGDDTYLIPQDNGDKIVWVKSDPRGYIAEASELNQKNDVFRKVVKFVKKWKGNCRKNDEMFCLKSFHLENIVKDIFTKNKDVTVYDALLIFYSGIDYYLSEPKFPDRADEGIFTDEYIKEFSEDEIEKIVRLSEQTLHLLEMMEKCENDGEASKLIERIFSGKELFSYKVYSILNHALLRTFFPPSWQQPIRWPENIIGKIKLKCLLDGAKEIQSKKLVFPNHKLMFIAEPDVDYDEIYWQVVNSGDHAQGEKALRGSFFKAHNLEGKTMNNPLINWERTEYHGSHWIMCFAVNGGACVAVSDAFHINVFNAAYSKYKPPKRR